LDTFESKLKTLDLRIKNGGPLPEEEEESRNSPYWYDVAVATGAESPEDIPLVEGGTKLKDASVHEPYWARLVRFTLGDYTVG
jgi:hypothetical protein